MARGHHVEYQTRPRTKAAQRDATTRALISQARVRFAERGYADVSLAEVVEAAGVTKGALYHHFGGKQQLFRAVLADVHRDVADRIANAAPDADAWTQLLAGCETFLRASTEPGIQQIMLIDAPAVLGWGAWRKLDAATSVQQLEAVLTVLSSEGVIRDQPLQPLIHLLSGAMNESALWLANSDDRDRDLAHTMDALKRMLESLR
jgi:AcrR family transcriptional regulator